MVTRTLYKVQYAPSLSGSCQGHSTQPMSLKFKNILSKYEKSFVEGYKYFRKEKSVL